jgi:hypothetical protein
MEPWYSDCKASFILFGAFFINVEMSINQLNSTPWKIRNQPLISDCQGYSMGGDELGTPKEIQS